MHTWSLRILSDPTSFINGDDARVHHCVWQTLRMYLSGCTRTRSCLSMYVSAAECMHGCTRACLHVCARFQPLFGAFLGRSTAGRGNRKGNGQRACLEKLGAFIAASVVPGCYAHSHAHNSQVRVPLLSARVLLPNVCPRMRGCKFGSPNSCEEVMLARRQ